MQNTRSESQHRDLAICRFRNGGSGGRDGDPRGFVCGLFRMPRPEKTETVTIPDHTLYGDYLPKIAEARSSRL